MIIQTEKRSSRECYDEMMFVVANYQRLRRNPQMRLTGYTSFLKLWGVIAMAGTVICYLFYSRVFHNLIFLIMCGAFAVLLLLYGINYFRAEKMLKVYLSGTGQRTISINEEGVSYSDGTNSFSVDWPGISFVLVGRHCVSFVPEDGARVVISVPTDYLPQIREGLKEAGREELLIEK